MFIVYSPEGQSFIGVPPPKPQLRVDPIHPVRPVAESEQVERSINAEAEMHHPATKPQVAAYQDIQSVSAKTVVVQVHEIMTSPVITIDVEEDLNHAWQQMENNHIHALPVLREEGLVGILTRGDVLNYCAQQPEKTVTELLQQSVVDCMQNQVITTLPQTEIRRVAAVMHQYAISALPVMSETGSLTGMVTSSDLIERLAELPPLELYA